MEMFLIWLISKADFIFQFSAFLTIILMIAGVSCIIVVSCEGGEEEFMEMSKQITKKLHLKLIFITSLLIMIFMPSSKTIAAMYLIPKLMHNEQLQQVPNKALELLNLKLDDWINDLTDKKKD